MIVEMEVVGGGEVVAPNQASTSCILKHRVLRSAQSYCRTQCADFL